MTSKIYKIRRFDALPPLTKQAIIKIFGRFLLLLECPLRDPTSWQQENHQRMKTTLSHLRHVCHYWSPTKSTRMKDPNPSSRTTTGSRIRKIWERLPPSLCCASPLPRREAAKARRIIAWNAFDLHFCTLRVHNRPPCASLRYGTVSPSSLLIHFELSTPSDSIS